jgi:hypothetical protein
LEQITKVVESLKQEILQLEQQHAKLEQDKANQEKQTKIHDDAYNKGFADAESFAKGKQSTQGSDGDGADAENAQENAMENPMANPNEQATGQQLPNDILNGLEHMSNDELAVLIQQHPELRDLIK